MIAIKSERDINELTEKLRQGGSKQELGDYIKSQLSSDKRKQLDEILHDENALNEILNSPKAKELFSKLTGGNNGQS